MLPLSRLDNPEKGSMVAVTLSPVAIPLPSACPTTQFSSAELKVSSATVKRLRTKLLAVSKSPDPKPTPNKSKLEAGSWPWHTIYFVVQDISVRHICIPEKNHAIIRPCQ